MTVLTEVKDYVALAGKDHEYCILVIADFKEIHLLHYLHNADESEASCVVKVGVDINCYWLNRIILELQPCVQDFNGLIGFLVSDESLQDMWVHLFDDFGHELRE